MLTVWDTQVLEMPGALTALSARREGGEAQRSMTNIPLSVVVVDETTCIVEWTGDGKGPQGLKGHAQGAVSAGIRVFDRFWQLGTPIGDDAEGELDARDATVLRLMAAGVTDAAIARQTGFSQRTVERRVRHVMERLGAQTRFQAGCRPCTAAGSDRRAAHQQTDGWRKHPPNRTRLTRSHRGGLT